MSIADEITRIKSGVAEQSGLISQIQSAVGAQAEETDGTPLEQNTAALSGILQSVSSGTQGGGGARTELIGCYRTKATLNDVEKATDLKLGTQESYSDDMADVTYKRVSGQIIAILNIDLKKKYKEILLKFRYNNIKDDYQYLANTLGRTATVTYKGNQGARPYLNFYYYVADRANNYITLRFYRDKGLWYMEWLVADARGSMTEMNAPQSQYAQAGDIPTFPLSYPYATHHAYSQESISGIEIVFNCQYGPNPETGTGSSNYIYPPEGDVIVLGVVDDEEKEGNLHAITFVDMPSQTRCGQYSGKTVSFDFDLGYSTPEEYTLYINGEARRDVQSWFLAPDSGEDSAGYLLYAFEMPDEDIEIACKGG